MRLRRAFLTAGLFCLLAAAGSGALLPQERAAAPSRAPIFEATDEWREIRPEEHLPGGLDIRIDFASGKKYARLIQKEKSVPAAAAAVPPAPTGSGSGSNSGGTNAGLVALAPTSHELQLVAQPEMPETPSLTGDENASMGVAAERQRAGSELGLDEAGSDMLSVLKGLPAPEPELQAALAAGLRGDELQTLLRRIWDRRQALLKEAAAAAKTEAQLMQELLRRLNDAGRDSQGAMTEDELVDVLGDLEMYVAQLHNAEDFRGMGGLLPVTMLLNATSLRVGAAAAWTLGTAVKYAPKGQAEVVDVLGGIPMILGLLSRATAELSVFAAGPEQACSAASAAQVAAARAVYALGAMLRGSAQSFGSDTAVRRAFSQIASESVGGNGVIAAALRVQLSRAPALLAAARATSDVDEASSCFQAALAAKSLAAKILNLAADVSQELDAAGSDTSVSHTSAGVPITVLAHRPSTDAAVASGHSSQGADVLHFVASCCREVETGSALHALLEPVGALANGQISATQVDGPGDDDSTTVAGIARMWTDLSGSLEAARVALGPICASKTAA